MNKTEKRIIGKKLKALREKYMFSQQSIADFLEISQPMYLQYEKGNRTIKPEQLEKLCNLYLFTIEEFQEKTMKELVNRKWEMKGYWMN